MNIFSLKNGLIATAFVCTLAVASSEVQAAPVDLGQLQNGQTYNIPCNFGPVEAYFIADKDGKMQAQYTGGTQLGAFRDADHNNEIVGAFAYVNGKATHTYENIKAGETIYFYTNFSYDTGTITVTNGDLELKLEASYPSTNPADHQYYGGAFSVCGDSRISLNFNLPVQVASCTATVGASSVRINPVCGNNICEIDPAATLMNMYKNGTLKGGDTVSFKFAGVCEAGNTSNLYDGTGELVLDFVMAPQPLELVSTVNTPNSGMPNLLSYYSFSNPQSLVSFTFSGPLNSESGKNPVGTFTYGDPDNIEAGMYVEELQGHVEGNTVTFNFAGKVRLPAEMVPLLPEASRPDYIAFAVSNLYDTTGQRVYLPSASNPTSLPYTYHIVELKYNVVSDFTPGKNTALTAGTPMEIYIMDGAYLTYDGVQFDYYSTTYDREVSYVLGLDEVSVAPDDYSPETDVVLNFKMPNLPDFQPGSELKVSLNNLECADGLDHSSDVQMTYTNYTAIEEEDPELELISVIPAEDTALYAAGNYDGFVYTLNTNLNNKIAYVEAQWVDITDPDNPDIIAWTSASHIDENGVIPNTPIEITKVSIGTGEDMYVGHYYRWVVECYTAQDQTRELIGTITVDYTGATEPYVYSDIKLIDIDPLPTAYTITDAQEGKFTLTYSGPVTIDEEQSMISLSPWEGSPFESVTANADNTEFTFVIPVSVLTSYNTITCFVAAHDAQGRGVLPADNLMEFGSGENDKVGVLLDYESNMSFKPLTVSPGGGNVTELSRFTITCEVGETRYQLFKSWMAYPYIVKDREVVYTFNMEDDFEFDETLGWDDPIYSVDLVLPEPITEPGRYALIIPDKTFQIADETWYEQYNSKNTMVAYTIESNDITYDLYPVIDPAPGEVDSLGKFHFYFDKELEITNYFGIYILDADGEVVGSAYPEYDPDDFLNMNDFYLNFVKPGTQEPLNLTTPGTYTLVVPKGTFAQESVGWDGYGQASMEINETYVIRETVDVATLAADAFVGNVYDITGKVILRDATAGQLRNLDNGIYIVNGKKITLK